MKKILIILSLFISVKTFGQIAPINPQRQLTAQWSTEPSTNNAWIWFGTTYGYKQLVDSVQLFKHIKSFYLNPRQFINAGDVANPISLKDSIPTQTGNSGKVLGTNGTSLLWVTGGGGGGTTTNPLSLTYGFTGQPLSFNGSAAITGKIDTAASTGLRTGLNSLSLAQLQTKFNLKVNYTDTATAFANYIPKFVNSSIPSIKTFNPTISGSGTAFSVSPTFNITANGQTAIGFDLQPKFLSGIGSGFIATAGTSYTNGTYTSVALTGGTGSGAVATIIVSTNKVTTVTLTSAGTGYALGDQLSATAASIGGTGSGFTWTVYTLNKTGGNYIAINNNSGANYLSKSGAGGLYVGFAVGGIDPNQYLFGVNGWGYFQGPLTAATLTSQGAMQSYLSDVTKSVVLSGSTLPLYTPADYVNLGGNIGLARVIDGNGGAVMMYAYGTTSNAKINTAYTTGNDHVWLNAGHEGMRLSLSADGVTESLLLGTSTDIASSILTMNSTAKGFLPPRMTTTQQNAIASPQEGLVIYDNVLHSLAVRTNSAWIDLGTGGGGSYFAGTGLTLTGSTFSVTPLSLYSRVMTDGSGALTTQAEVIHQPAKYATAVALLSNTYNNGTSGVGATLTGNSNGALSVDGFTPSVNDRVLVWKEATQSNNGIYIVTQVGSGSLPYILTRGPYSSIAANMAAGSQIYIQSGTNYTGVTFTQSTTGTIVFGTTNLVYTSNSANFLTNTFTGTGTIPDPYVFNTLGPGFSTTPTAFNVMVRDGNTNSFVNNLIENYNSIVTSASTTTLLVSSAHTQTFTGTTTQTVLLPVVSTLLTGHVFRIANNSTGIVTVQSSGANTVQALAANTSAIFTFNGTAGTAAASWDVSYSAGGSGGMTVSTFSASSQANGATISGSTITFGPADQTNPGMVSTGAQTWTGTKTINTNQNAATKFVINNQTSGGNAEARIDLLSTSSSIIGQYSPTTSAYGALVANNAYWYTTNSVGITFMADNASGSIRFAAGGNAEIARVSSDGSITSGVAGSKKGTFKITGNTSGTISIVPQAIAGTYEFDLPTTAGLSGQVVQTQGGAGTAMTYIYPGKPYAHTTFTPTTGGTVTLVSHQENIVNPAGTLSTLTIALPASPSNNDRVDLSFTQVITSLSYSGGTVVGGQSSAAIGGQWHLIYDTATTSWYQ